jgi:hypothetical protein
VDLAGRTWVFTVDVAATQDAQTRRVRVQRRPK